VADTPELPVLPDGRFDGRQQFQQWLRQGFGVAAQQGWSELVLGDADFVDWPLGELAVVDALQSWAQAGRRLVLLAADFAPLQRRHVRFVQWRIQWDHLIACHRLPSQAAAEVPSAMWSAPWCLRQLDSVHCRGWASAEPQRGLQTREALAECLRRSVPAFPASVLGL
jgi:hypothetical protein